MGSSEAGKGNRLEQRTATEQCKESQSHDHIVAEACIRHLTVTPARIQDYYLTCLRCLAEVDGFAPGQQEEHVEELEHLAAGLVDGSNHCPAVPGQASQRLRHEERRGAAHIQPRPQLNKLASPPPTDIAGSHNLPPCTTAATVLLTCRGRWWARRGRGGAGA